MSEQNHDPLHELANFDTAGIALAPLPPSEVRRLGNRRRAQRRTTAVIAAAVIAVLAIGVPVALTRGGDPDGSRDIATTPTPTPSTTTTTPSSTTPTTVTYPGSGIEVKTATDVDKLTGTSQEFKDFIALQAQKAAADGTDCPDAAHGVTVQKYSSAGYAIGGVNSCGGYMALWVDRDDQWQEGMGTQDAWDCDTLGYLGVPHSFAGDCFDEAGDFGPTGTDGVDLGMTTTQVEAAGGKVEQGPAGSCSTLLLPFHARITNQTDGYIAPGKGVVLLAARPGVKTPDKIGLGSAKAKVQQAYPNGHLSNGYWVVPLGHGSEYEFGLNGGGTVTEVLLADATGPCTQ
jgi:hypothetical protein